MAGAAAACGIWAAPKIHVQTPFSQPQKPPDDDEDEDVAALGEGDGVGVAGTPLLPAAALVDGVADTDDAGSDGVAGTALPVVLAVGLALVCGVAVTERDDDADAEALPLPLVAVDVPQTEVGNGSGFDPVPAAFAGVASVSAPATATRATGAPIAAMARRDRPSVLRTFGGTRVLLLHLRKVGRRRFFRPWRFE